MKYPLLIFTIVGLFMACEKPQSKLLGTWEGSTTSNTKVSFIFKTDKDFSLAIKNDIAVGTYTLDETKKPHQIVLKPKGSQEIYGILEFMGPRTCRIQMKDDPQLPSSFDAKEQIVLSKVD